jgi:phenylpropionate dioxygenase-like ring-hydroxylating dioxygenase large terminal subunit
MTATAATALRLHEGHTLPATWYGDPGVWEVEKRRIFARSWQYACPAEWVANPGDYAACDAGHVPLVVARGDDGGLRAHVNVCRHRAHIVAEGHGNRKVLQCPYHAWCYGLDGSLRSAPRSDRESVFAGGDLALLPASAEAWGPFVFVNPDPDAAPLAATLGRLPELIAEGGVDLAGIRFRERRVWDPSDVNWKVAIENDLECYHCPVAHPGFSDLIDVSPDAYRLETGPAYTSQYGPLRDVARGDGAPYDTSGAVARTQSHLVWPNVSINVNPGPPNAGMHVWRPDGPHRIAGLSDYYFAPGTDPDVIAGIMEFDREVGAEDNALVLCVQEGIDSGMLDRGRVLAESERLVRHFQLMVAEALAP